MKEKITLKKMWLLLAVLLWGVMEVQAQTTITVGATGNFSTIQEAYNTGIPGTISGAYILELLSDYVPGGETYPITLGSKTGASALNSITIRPAATVSVTLAGTASTTGIFLFDGAKYVTIDGQSGGTGGTKNLTITNPNTAASANTIKFQNDAYKNNIKYCSVSGSAASTTSAPTSGTIVIAGTTGTTARAGSDPNFTGSGNLYNTIDNCDIANASGGLPTVGVYMLGTATYTNEGNAVTNCNIYNYFNPSAYTSSGIYVGANAQSSTITGNKLYQTATRTYTAGGTHYPIYIASTTKSVSTNTIGYSSSTGTGTMTINGDFTHRCAGIYVTKLVTTLQGNVITDIDYRSSHTASGVEGVLVGICYTGGNLNAATQAFPNNIKNITFRPTTSIAGTISLAGFYYSYSSGGATFSYNNIDNLQILPTTTNLNANLYGIYGYAYGVNPSLNNISNLSCGASGNTGTYNVYGIYTSFNSSSSGTVQKNNIYNLNAITSGTATIAGIAGVCQGGTSLPIYQNNLIDLGNSVTSNVTIYGILQGSTPTTCGSKYYNNSVFIGGTAPANATQNSFAFYSSSATIPSTTNDIRNNIFVNQRVNTSGFAKHFALGYLTAGVIKTCDYNLYFATPLGLSVSTDQTALSGLAYSGSDANSLIGTPGFKNPTASTPDLTYYSTINTVDGKANPSILTTDTKDYSGITRTNPDDIGAYKYTASGTPVSTSIAYSGSGSATTDNPIQLTVTFGASVTGFDITDLIIRNGNASNFSGSGTTYTVDIIPTGAAISVDIPAGAAVDGSENANSQPTQWSVAYNAVTVSGGATASYQTIKAAFDAINAGTHTGAITVALNAGTTETASAVLNASGSGSASYTSVTIYPTTTGIIIGGNLPAPLIDLYGADNVTINGSINQANDAKSLSIINTNTSATAGTSTIRMYNDASNNTVKYCTLKGSAQVSTGSVVLIGAGLTGGSGNDNINIQNNDITTAVSATASRPLNSILCSGSTALLSNDNITIQDNNIFDFLNSATSTNGVNFNLYSTTVSISGNSFYETTIFAPTSTATYYAIVCNWANLSGITISGNYIGGSAPQCGGSAWTKTSSNNNNFNGIYYSGTTSGTAASIQNNTIKNFDYSNSSTGTFIGFYIQGGKINIGTQTGNTLGSTSGNGSISFTSAGGNFYGILINTSATAIDCQNNIIASITTTGLASGNSSNIRCITVDRSTETINVSNNIIGSSTTNSIYASGASTGGSQLVLGIYLQNGTSVTASNNTITNMTNNVNGGAANAQIAGIYSTVAGTQTISNNTISGISVNNPSASTTKPICGIYLNNSATTGNTITQNTITGISSSSSYFAQAIYGLYYLGKSSGTNSITRNLIYGLSVDPATTAASLYGIYISAGTTTYANNIINLGGNTQSTLYGIYETGATSNNNSLYHNSVYIGGTPTTGALNSYALYSNASTNTRDFRNNIFVNARTNNGATGKHYGAYFNYTVNTNLTLNNNLYYAPNSGGVLGYYNAADVTSGTEIVSGLDAGSINNNPQFLSPTATTPDLRINSNYTVVDQVGADLSATVTDDYYGNTRSGLTPHDIGAYAYSYQQAGTEFYKSAASGNWGTANTWEKSFDSSNWETATSAPTSTAATITIQNAHEVTVAANATSPALTVQGGGKLTLNNTFGLTAASLNLQSDASNGTATIKDLNANGGLTVTGSTTVNQYLTTGRNWYISNPVAATTLPTVASGTLTLHKYDESIVSDAAGATGWVANPASVEVGKGYVASVSANGDLTFTGTLNTGAKNITLTSRSGVANKAGFNLVGNPYPSYLDWDAVTTANTDKLRSTTLWYRTKKLNQNDELVYQFWTVNGDGIGVPNGASVKIPPMQSFWVRSIAGGTTLNLTNAMRSHAPATDKLLKAPAAKNSGRTLVRLQVSNGVNSDEAVIYFSDKASDGQDLYDSPKMSNGNVAIPEIFTTIADEKIVINSMNTMPLNQEIKLGFVAGDAASFSLKANEINNLPEDVKLILKDNVSNTETDLTDGVTAYQFAPAATTSDRFSVIFRTAGSATGLRDVNADAKVHVNAAKQIVILAQEKSAYSIHDARGQLLVNAVTTSTTTVPGIRLQPGIYLVKIAGNLTSKVIIP